MADRPDTRKGEPRPDRDSDRPGDPAAEPQDQPSPAPGSQSARSAQPDSPSRPQAASAPRHAPGQSQPSRPVAREGRAAGGGRPLDVEADARWSTPGLYAGARGVPVQEVMTRELVIAPLSWTAADAARAMREENVGFLPVCQSDGTPVGVVTDRDLTVRVLAEDLPGSTRLEEVMTPDPIAVHAGDDLAAAEVLMRRNQISRLLVLDDDETLVGIISVADLAQYEDESRVGAILADVTVREAEPR